MDPDLRRGNGHNNQNQPVKKTGFFDKNVQKSRLLD